MLGGLAMFLYGMRLMGDALKSSSGGAMKAALQKVTNNPALGFLFGMLVTCMIQSSTATIVLTVGLVGAGFLTFRQSVGVVLGANVGTAITAQIIRLMDVSAGETSILYLFKADNLAPIALIIGIILIMFLKGGRANNIGTVLIGFGILFMGLIYMSSSVGDMSDILTGLLTKFEGNYVLGFATGVGATAVIQSSSAVVGIVQSMASSMGVRFCAVFAIIIGVNIGDCLTTFIVSSIGAKPVQIRTALVHVIYNILAAILIIVVLVIGRSTGLIGDDLWFMTLHSGGVANVHGVFRLLPAVLFLPFSGLLARAAEKLVPDKPLDEEDQVIEESLRELDQRLINNPTLALYQVTQLIGHMAEVALHNFEASIDQVFQYEQQRNERMAKREEQLDRMADASNRYLVDISPYIIQEADSRNQSFQIKALTSFERIGDLAINMGKDAETVHDSQVSFSEHAMGELTIVSDAVREILTVTYEAYIENNLKKIATVEPMEEVIDELVETVKAQHIRRVTKNECEIQNGIIFENILTNMERVSDQCSDLAVFMLSRSNPEIIGNEHAYIHKLHHSNDSEYLRVFHSNYKRYFRRLGLDVDTNPETDEDA